MWLVLSKVGDIERESDQIELNYGSIESHGDIPPCFLKAVCLVGDLESHNLWDLNRAGFVTFAESHNLWDLLLLLLLLGGARGAAVAPMDERGEWERSRKI